LIRKITKTRQFSDVGMASEKSALPASHEFVRDRQSESRLTISEAFSIFRSQIASI
jgi:hypothetical protein